MYDVSKHGKKRLKERTTKSKRIVDLALSRGKTIDTFVGSFRRYLDKIRTMHDSDVSLIVYNNNIFVFSHINTLITILNIPSKYLKYQKESSTKEAI